MSRWSRFSIQMYNIVRAFSPEQPLHIFRASLTDEVYGVRKRRLTYFVALKTWKGRSGHMTFIFLIKTFSPQIQSTSQWKMDCLISTNLGLPWKQIWTRYYLRPIPTWTFERISRLFRREAKFFSTLPFSSSLSTKEWAAGIDQEAWGLSFVFHCLCLFNLNNRPPCLDVSKQTKTSLD